MSKKRVRVNCKRSPLKVLCSEDTNDLVGIVGGLLDLFLQRHPEITSYATPSLAPCCGVYIYLEYPLNEESDLPKMLEEIGLQVIV